MIAPLALVAFVVSAAAAIFRRQRRRRLPAQSVIVSPRRSTVIARDGGVRSVQSAVLTMAVTDLERIWTPANLENLARTYWRFLSRVTLGFIRVKYTADSRSVMLLGRPLTLLRFGAPEYTIEDDHGAVRWPIRDGLLVARGGRGSGFLALDVRREPTRAPAGTASQEDLRIEVEVANFYPSIAVGFSEPVYEMTQSAVHVLVTHAFLRSLANLDLARSKTGQFADQPDAADWDAAAERSRESAPAQP
ncbi:MAG TPA: hypothetical protein VHV28_01795 [Solirubrobacteraceae bacterium]|nr:hypothetical protein [Solirubrobacteraceae bacterium]